MAEGIELWDQGGAEPDDTEPASNRPHRYPRSSGGKLVAELDPETFAVVKTALDAHTAPRAEDDRPVETRRAAALGEIARFSLCHEDLPDTGGERPQVHVLLTLEELEHRARGTILHTGEKLAPAALRRHLCDAQVIPHVLGGHGEILDVGRARRTIPAALRRALVIRDRGCCFPGCDKPPSWTECHHIVEWQHGGPTEINNLVLLCGRHHDVLHRTEWRVDIRDGRPEFTPPKWARAACDAVP